VSNPLTVIYSCQPETTSGFSRYVLHTWKPRRLLAQRFVDGLRRDPRFPRHVQTRDLLSFYLRHRRTLPWERRLAADAWRSYERWQAQQKQAA
jgi:hypothetical protein